jgi:nicotinamide phosphoribosyltransferase
MKYTRKNHKTPRLLIADAYTIGAHQFQSPAARKKSVYYITFRRILEKINPELYSDGDNRILFFQLQRILDRILYKPVEQWEIDSSVEFLATAKVNSKGELKRYWCPIELWQEVVDKYNGRPPIRITAMPEGSVVYPNEPCIMIESLVDGFGELAAWFESKILQTWAGSEAGTQDRHFYDKVRNLYKKYFPNLSQKEINFYASIVLTDFGDRAGMNLLESEDIGMTHLYTFGGSDTFAAGYQAWMNSNKTPGVCTSVYALAHRNVQAWENEGDAYTAIYEAAEHYDFISMVNDCYCSRNAVEKYHIPLALRSLKEGNGKVVVTRPDSGVALDEVMWTIQTAIKYGLFEEKIVDGKKWITGTYLHFIEGDGLTHHDILEILTAMLEAGYIPWTWGLFGMGGGQRNALKRDNLSAKYALAAMDDDYTPVVKFSETFGKTTLPGPFKVLRSPEALANKKTIVFANEAGENAMVIYYDGLAEEFFDGGMLDDFNVIKERSHQQFDNMPLSLCTEENHGYPASDNVLEERRRLLTKYAPDKEVVNY